MTGTPCAGTPTAIMVGTGLDAQRGVLVKNAIALESSARIEVVVLDKTGTLTKGEPEVTDGIGEDELLELVAAVERESEHPLARAIVYTAEKRGGEAVRAGRFVNVPGHGAIAHVDSRRVAVGKRTGIWTTTVNGSAAPASSTKRTSSYV